MSDDSDTALRWERVVEWFDAVSDLPATERERVLNERCDDARVRAEVIELLAAEARAGTALEPSSQYRAHAAAGSAPLDSHSDEPEVERVGPYRLVRRIGEGGMGTVWLAHRNDDAFEQEVAVKLIKRGMDSAAIVSRFLRERQVLARLRHDGVAHLLDGGTTEDGRPYLVMELVDGASIDRHCTNRNLDLNARLTLFAQVCDAVDAAHALGIVHRDLKPANILVTDDGRPKLLDFGIAKAFEPDGEADSSLLTLTGQRVLTPRYAAPEQVRGEQITPATDVYSLGVVLYELTTGCSPYGAVTTTGRELESAICDGRPPLPSRTAAPELRRGLRGDVDVIALCALAKDPSRRYRSAGELAADLRHHLAHRPIAARRDSFAYRARTFARRNRAFVIATATVILSLAVGLMIALQQYLESERLRGISEQRREDAEWQAYSAGIEQAFAALGRNLGVPTDRFPAHLRGWEYQHLLGRTNQPSVFHRGRKLTHLSIDAAGESLAAVNELGVIILDAHSGAVRRQIASPTRVTAVALSRDGRRVAAAHRRGFRAYDLESGAVLLDIHTDTEVVQVDFHPDGDRLASGRSGLGATVSVRSIATGQLLFDFEEPSGPVKDVAFSPDGRFLALGTAGGVLRLLSAAEPSSIYELEIHPDRMSVSAIAFSSDSRLLAGVFFNGVSRVFDTRDGRPITTPIDSGSYTQDLAFLPGRDQLLQTASALQLRDLRTGAVSSLAIGTDRTSFSVAVHPTEPRVFVTDNDGTTIRECRTDDPPLPRHHLSERRVLDLAIHPDSSRYAAVLLGRSQVVVQDIRSGIRLAELDIPKGASHLSYSPEGTELVVTGIEGITVFDATTYDRLAHLPLQGAHLAAFSTDTRGFYCASAGTLVICAREPWRIERTLDSGLDLVRDLVTCPDGRVAIAGRKDARSQVRLWDPTRGAPIGFCAVPITSPVLGVSPDGRWLAIGSNGMSAIRLLVHDLRTGERVMQATEGGSSRAVLFTPDSARLIEAVHGTPIVYETARWRPIVRFYDGLRGICCLAMSADGSVMLSGDLEGDVRVWKARPDAPPQQAR